MKSIVVIGNSVAGLRVIEKLRENDPAWEATVFTMGEKGPYDRSRFPMLIAQKATAEGAVSHPGDYFEKAKITVSTEKLARVNFKKNAVFTEEKRAQEYDVLVIAATENFRLPEIKGANKTNVVGGGKFKDLEQILAVAPLAETVVVQGQDLNSVKFAAAMHKRNPETIFIPTAKTLAPLDEESSQKICQRLQDVGVRVMGDTSIAEILGDTEAKAIRLKSGKVIGCQLIVLTEELPDLRLFKDSGIALQERIVVDKSGCTNVANVYAAAELAATITPSGWTNFDNCQDILCSQGQLIAAQILGEQDILPVPSGELTLEIDGISFSLISAGADSGQFKLTMDEQSAGVCAESISIKGPPDKPEA